LKETVANGGQCILIGTKKPAQSIILRVASHTGMPFVINRWVGGTLSNNDQVRKAVTRLLYLRDVLDRPTGHYKKKELSMIQKEVGRLEKNVGGIIDFRFPPAALIIVDAQKEISAIKEANRLGIPVIAIVDTNTNPEGVSFIIPANDDSPKSITFLMDYLEQNMLEGLEIWKSKLTEEEKQRITHEQEERVARHKEHEASMKAKQEAREQRQAAADAEPTSDHRPFGRSNHGGERKPFQKRFGGQRFEHRSENQDDEGGSEDRPSRPEGDRPYTPRGDRPYTPRGDRPYTPRGDRPYTPRSEGDRPYTPRGDRPYTPRPEGDRPYTPRGDRPYTPRPDGDRPYTPRGDRPYTPRGDRPYTPRPDGDRPYTPRGDRPFTPRGDRPYTPRPTTEQTPKQAPEQTPKDTDNKSE
jgi:ribosomal protein S2